MMKRYILCFPRDHPGPGAFRHCEVYEFEGTTKELLVECAKLSLEFESRRTFSYFFVLHQKDWHEAMMNLDRYDDFYLLADLVLEPDMLEADRIARSLGIQSPTLLYLAWEPESFYEELSKFIAFHEDELTFLDSAFLEVLIEDYKTNPSEAVGVDFAFLNVDSNQEFAECIRTKYFAFLYDFKKFMIVDTNYSELKVFYSTIFDNVEDELDLYRVLSNLVK